MYHIKPDKRAITSTKLICDAVLDLMKEKPFSRITVTDVQKTSSVSRSTFYRNFDQLEDVLEFLCDRGFQSAFSDSSEEHISVAVFRYWSNHSDILEALVNIHRTDILYSSFRRTALNFEHLRTVMPNSEQYDYFVSIITSTMIGILITWIEHERRETQDEVLQLINDSFSVMTMLHIL